MALVASTTKEFLEYDESGGAGLHPPLVKGMVLGVRCSHGSGRWPGETRAARFGEGCSRCSVVKGGRPLTLTPCECVHKVLLRVKEMSG